MKRITAMGWALVLGCAAASPQTSSLHNFTPETVRTGAAIFARNCSPCHGEHMADPQGAFDLRTFPSSEHERFINSVTNGKNSMPPWGGFLKPGEIEALWAYVMAGENPSPAASTNLVTSKQLARIAGVVKDQTGAVMAGAKVVLRDGGISTERTTDARGEFVFEGFTAASGTLVVDAPGFDTQRRDWRAKDPELLHLEIVLTPARLEERITVTATRVPTRVSETAASVTVLSADDLSTSGALTLDDTLRQVPGFSLFRQSGSRTANPTSQGVTLRGVGASGASRALVLSNGIPLNDPFGGWVYWDRVPRQSVGSAEVVQGGTSDLYGSDALGGVVNFMPRKITDSSLALEASYGNEQTPYASVSGSVRAGQWVGTVAAQGFHTNGYFLVPDSQRGSVDTRAGSEYGAGDLTLERLIGQRGRLFARGSLFAESRENGKALERNRTHIRQLAAGGEWQSAAVGSFSLRGYGGPQVFDQNFYAIALGRNSETLTRDQRVPAQQIGGSAQWARPAGLLQTLVAGIEGREVRGSSDELLYTAGKLSSAVGAGGRQRTFGLFGEDILHLTPRWIITAGARVDRWRNYDALSTTRPLSKPGPTVVKGFPERTEHAFSPRISALYRLNESISLNASAYRAFRAPTLNELYRSFRLGNVLTLANKDLFAEHLTGAEGGASVAAFHNRLTARGTFFWAEVTRAIANVTLAVTPALITRERENLARTRSRGVELDFDARLTNSLGLSGGCQFADASVVSSPAQRSLDGLLVPLVPRKEATFQVRYSHPSRLTLAMQGRAVGPSFDDDQNLLKLNSYFSLDAIVSRPVSHNVEVFTAFENLSDRRYEIAKTPFINLGPPILVRGGVRLQLGSR
jgi:outer membrane receptor protein involved in Fe transport/mono/diheme cytochrome c family protein